MLATPVRFGVASDDTLLTLGHLDLQPIARALLHVKAIALLREDSFQPAPRRYLKQLAALLWIVVRESHDAAIFKNGLQLFLAFLQANAAEVVAIQVQQVKSVVDHRNAFPSADAALARLISGALLHQAERWTSLLIERDDFSIENRALSLHQCRKVAKFRKLCRKVIVVSRDQSHVAIFHESHGAV